MGRLRDFCKITKVQQDGNLEIQQNSQPDSKTYFFSMRPRRSELFNQKLIRIIKSLSSKLRQKNKKKLADSNI